jgi:hypothetical protein
LGSALGPVTTSPLYRVPIASLSRQEGLAREVLWLMRNGFAAMTGLRYRTTIHCKVTEYRAMLIA